jgi:hypothetical protein
MQYKKIGIPKLACDYKFLETRGSIFVLLFNNASNRVDAQ